MKGGNKCKLISKKKWKSLNNLFDKIFKIVQKMKFRHIYKVNRKKEN